VQTPAATIFGHCIHTFHGNLHGGRASTQWTLIA